MQTYEPSSPGMIACISGGEYVKTSDHLAAMEEKDREIAGLKAEIAMLNSVRSTRGESENRLQAKLSRLIELINSKENKEKITVAVKPGNSTLYITTRREAISDYQEMLTEEVKKL